MAYQVFGQEALSGHNYLRVSPQGALYVTAIDAPAYELASSLSAQFDELSASLDVGILEMKGSVKTDLSEYYTEITWLSGNPVNIDKWTDANKTVKVFSETLTWLSGNLTESVKIDEITSETFTTSLSYDGNDNLTHFTEGLT